MKIIMVMIMAMLPLSATADFDSHPNYAVLMTLVQSYVDTIRTKQSEYFVKNKRYFQGLQIPTVGTLDGTGTGQTLDVSKRPSDQDDSWKEFDDKTFSVNAKLPLKIKIDTYASPLGHGWILTFMLVKDLGTDKYGSEGNIWIYRHHDGPEKIEGVWDDWHILVMPQR